MNLITQLVGKMMFVSYFEPVDGKENAWEWVDTVVNAILTVLWPILIIVSAAGMIYAVIIGINMARADSTDKREEAKKRLINVIIGIAVVIALILLFQLVAQVIIPALLPTVATTPTPPAA